MLRRGDAESVFSESDETGNAIVFERNSHFRGPAIGFGCVISNDVENAHVGVFVGLEVFYKNRNARGVVGKGVSPFFCGGISANINLHRRFVENPVEFFTQAQGDNIPASEQNPIERGSIMVKKVADFVVGVLLSDFRFKPRLHTRRITRTPAKRNGEPELMFWTRSASGHLPFAKHTKVELDKIHFVVQSELCMNIPVMMKKPSAFLPVAMSLTALAIVLVHVAFYGTAREADEGAAAHLWQLLMVAQLPVLLFFAVKWAPHSPRQALPVMALQAAAVVAALAPVYLLKL